MTVDELTGAAGLRRFVALPWKILDARAHPQWLPPLRLSTTTMLDPAKNPFFGNATRALFVATEHGRPVGRVAAIHNGWAADAGQEPGFMGFFDCVDRQDVADALLERAEDWLRAKGCRVVTGPMNPSTNYEGGVLVDGFEHPQTFFTAWNPPHYESLLTNAGYGKAADLLAWHVDLAKVPADLDDRLRALAERAAQGFGLSIDSVDFRHFDRDMRHCWTVYSECWKAQWGFVPLSVEEWLFIAHELKPLMVSEGAMLVRSHGEIVGFGLLVADFSRAMSADRSGRLLPFNWLRILRARRHAPWVRIILAGALPRFRRLGVPQLLLHQAAKHAKAFGVEHLEASWILENNHDLNPFFDRVGATQYRRWRVFAKPLVAGAAVPNAPSTGRPDPA